MSTHTTRTHRGRNIAALFVTLLLIGGASTIVAPTRTYASDPDSPIQVLKDTVNVVQTHVTSVLSSLQLTNPVFYRIAQAVLSSIVKSTINWVNSGFNGSPAFVTNLQGTLLQAGDTQAQLFIQQYLADGSVNSPFRDAVGQAALSAYLQRTSGNGFFTQNAFTLGQVSPDPSAFLHGDISQGGLSAWLVTTLGPGNNPYALQNALDNALNGRVAGAQGSLLTQLGWGNGFKSFQGNCAPVVSSAAFTTARGMKVISNPTIGTLQTGPTLNTPDTGASLGGNLAGSAANTVSLNSTDPCAGQPIKTPGTIIMAGLEKSLGTGIDQLLNAKEFDELVNALLSQLLNQVIGGGGGLSGVSQPSATGQSFINSASTNTGLSSGVAVATAMAQVVTTQSASLQQYVADWQKILTAATNAKSALSTTTCVPNAQSLITGTVQPIIDQATAAISRGTAANDKLQGILNQIVNVATANDSTLQSAQISTAYSNFSADASTPSLSDIDYAAQQANDTTSTSAVSPSVTPSLLTQMNTLTAQAKCGP